MATIGAFEVILNGDGYVLSVKQNYPPHQWSLPSRRVEANESPLAALHREDLEETGRRNDGSEGPILTHTVLWVVIAELDSAIHRTPRGFMDCRLKAGNDNRGLEQDRGRSVRHRSQ